jgi:hypothetical protein
VPDDIPEVNCILLEALPSKLTAAAGSQTEAVQNPTSQNGSNNTNNDDYGINNDNRLY